MAKMRARRISGSRWVTRSGSRPSGIARASRSAMPSRRSAWASNVTPPSELIRPPSKAAVIFLRRTAGKQNGRRLSSVMAGVRASIPAKGWLQQPNPTPDQQLTLLPPPLIRPRHEYDRLNSRRGQRKVARYASLHPTHVGQKVEIIVEHFRRHVMADLHGQAKAMIVTQSREHALRYYFGVGDYLKQQSYTDLKALVAFSGDLVLDGETWTEAALNGFSETELP